MFTGLVESTGRVLGLESRGEQARLTLDIPFAGELQHGESVAVNGCCLTAGERSGRAVAFDILKQTLTVTSLGDLTAGRSVNLERALRVGDRFGGHFVQGHIDGCGEIERLEADGNDHLLEVRLPPALVPFCVPKGSLAVDGISLTIAETEGVLARFWIIPHTYARTHLHEGEAGQRVNLEADLLAKHVAHLLGERKP